jgi:RNA polymerase sigma-70 factor (ECF subfamily)
MNDPGDTVEALLTLAKTGHASALGQLLERYRNYLELLARIQIGRRLQSKVDATDLVQETFLDAHTTFAQFRGATEKELVGWLRQVLAYNLATLMRHYYGVQRRDVELERQLSLELDQSSQALDAAFVAPISSPSQQAARREQAVILADALGRLPPEYREVVILRQLQGLTFPEVARQMNRSLDSVKKLFVRGLARLRGVLGDKHESA